MRYFVKEFSMINDNVFIASKIIVLRQNVFRFTILYLRRPESSSHPSPLFSLYNFTTLLKIIKKKTFYGFKTF